MLDVVEITGEDLISLIKASPHITCNLRPSGDSRAHKMSQTK